MAEAIGLAASMAGLIAFTGQIAKTGLFIKSFLSDINNAPDDIRMLAIEFELLSTAAAKTGSMLDKCKSSVADLDLEHERKALARYADLIKQLGVKIEKDVARFGAGGGRWWERLGSAARKKELAEFLVGVERSKTLMMDLEIKVVANMQHQQSNTLAHISGNILKVLSGVSEIEPAIRSLSEARAGELSALDSILDSAIQRGLQRHHREAGATGHPGLITEEKQAGPSMRVKWPIEEDRQVPSYGAAFIRLDKVVYRSTFQTSLFDIEIETKEVQRQLRPNEGPSNKALSKFEPTISQRFTKYHVRIKLPFWKGGVTCHSGNSGMVYSGSLCKSLRMYNTVPEHSPIIKACEQFDMAKVKRLFKKCLASPLDCDERARTLFEVVTFQLLYSDTQTDVQKGLELLEFLIQCLGGQVNVARAICYIMLRAQDFNTSIDHTRLPWVADLSRILISHSSEDPFTDSSRFLDINFSKSAAYSVFCGQQQWWFDYTVTIDYPEYENYFFETDLCILRDPEGYKLEAALAAGRDYDPFISLYTDLAAVVKSEGQIHTLLYLASKIGEETFRECVSNRLVILLRHGMNPRRVLYSHTIVRVEDEVPRNQLSCTSLARHLGLSDLWISALDKAGLTQSEVQDIFDEDLYAGVPELLDSVLEYTSRCEQQKQFIGELRQGIFPEDVDVFHRTLFYSCTVLEHELGIYPCLLYYLMKEVFSVSCQYAMPGRWNDGQAINLIPGRDYKLPSNCPDGEKYMRDWTCVRKIWETELGGCIPEGCEENRWERKRRIKRDVATSKRKEEFERAGDSVCTEDQIADEFYDNVTSHENTKSIFNFRSLVKIEADDTIKLASDEHYPETYHDAHETQEE